MPSAVIVNVGVLALTVVHVVPPSVEYWRDATVPLSLALRRTATLDVYQPFSPSGAAGVSRAATVGGVTSATPSPTKVSRSRTTPPEDVTYRTPVPVGTFARLALVSDHPPLLTATVANGVASGASQRRASVPDPGPGP